MRFWSGGLDDEINIGVIYQIEIQKEEQSFGEIKEFSFENIEFEFDVLLMDSVKLRWLY